MTSDDAIRVLVERLRGHAWIGEPDIAEAAAALLSLAARVERAEAALAADPILTDKELLSAVITVVMNDKQAVRNEACLKLQSHILAVERERDARETECEHLTDQVHLAERLAHDMRENRDALLAWKEQAISNCAKRRCAAREAGHGGEGV